jgi:hypothetical protein
LQCGEKAAEFNNQGTKEQSFPALLLGFFVVKNFLVRGEKAAEGRRTPRRCRVHRRLPNHAKRLGVRQPSGALAFAPEKNEQTF